MLVSRVLVILAKLEDWLMVGTLAYMVCIIFFQVVLRYFFKNPISWPEESARFMQIWLIYLGVSACVREEKHIKISVVLENIRTEISNYLEKIANIISILLLSFLFYLSIRLVMDFINYGQKSPALNFPMYIVAICLPIGLGFSTLRYLIKFFCKNN
jgi:C4-dicarboxylate transporter DctQ subunit